MKSLWALYLSWGVPLESLPNAAGRTHWPYFVDCRMAIASAMWLHVNSLFSTTEMSIRGILCRPPTSKVVYKAITLPQSYSVLLSMLDTDATVSMATAERFYTRCYATGVARHAFAHTHARALTDVIDLISSDLIG